MRVYAKGNEVDGDGGSLGRAEVGGWREGLDRDGVRAEVSVSQKCVKTSPYFRRRF